MCHSAAHRFTRGNMHMSYGDMAMHVFPFFTANIPKFTVFMYACVSSHTVIYMAQIDLIMAKAPRCVLIHIPSHTWYVRARALSLAGYKFIVKNDRENCWNYTQFDVHFVSFHFISLVRGQYTRRKCAKRRQNLLRAHRTFKISSQSTYMLDVWCCIM